MYVSLISETKDMSPEDRERFYFADDCRSFFLDKKYRDVREHWIELNRAVRHNDFEALSELLAEVSSIKSPRKRRSLIAYINRAFEIIAPE